MATVGGNLLQRTRCGYFTDVSGPCNKRVPGSGCPAVTGEHHQHAVLGASDHCVAVHPSDMGVALTALDAVVGYETGEGPEEKPITDFYLPVGDTLHRETALPRARSSPTSSSRPRPPEPAPATARSANAPRTPSPSAPSPPGSPSRTAASQRHGWRWAPSPPGPGAPTPPRPS